MLSRTVQINFVEGLAHGLGYGLVLGGAITVHNAYMDREADAVIDYLEREVETLRQKRNSMTPRDRRCVKKALSLKERVQEWKEQPFFVKPLSRPLSLPLAIDIMEAVAEAPTSRKMKSKI